MLLQLVVLMEVIYWSKRLQEFVRSLDDQTSMRVDRTIQILADLGHLIEMTDSKSLGGGLFELRTQGRKRVRIIYLFKNGKAY